MDNNTVLTATDDILPIIDHIKTLQNEVKRLEADIKQHKELLTTTYMQDISKIVNTSGQTIAQWVNQIRESFSSAELKKADIETYNLYAKKIEIKFVKVG